MEIAALLIGAAVVPPLLWFPYCNDKTLKQRLALIECSMQEPGLVFSWPSGSYSAHLWRLFFFRDPWAIYPIEFRRIAYRNNLTKVNPDAEV